MKASSNSSSLGRMARKLAPVALTLVVVAVAALAGREVWARYADTPWTRDAHLRADVLQVAPDVGGLVTEVQVRDNQAVHAGDVLFRIDPARYELAVSQARAAVAQSRAARGQASAALANQRALLEQAQREAARNRKLSDLVAQETVEQGDLKVHQGEAAVALAQAQQAAAQASEAAATAALNTAELNLERTTVRSPVNGYLNDRAPRVGDYVATGRPVLSVVDGGAVYVDGYFEETKIDHLQPGQAVSIRLMGRDATLRGHVQSVAAGIEDRDRTSGNNMLPNVNPSFNWVRLAQRVPVRIAVDAWPAGERPTIGRTATVSVLEQQGGRP
ncbi:HlyD family secretion protein [Paucibacter sp. R3-3]|uniref:HlyD family secretion protein n=1 Tax=Roseateles agri TaxID=3098619 RepID=A0ABU5DC10_9BURK|nr:HlyD family secretion protein [Paucibacter sp. R3-3]MDY0743816.1 HlyD family secretion protein [Paucibacter sp. R3-3]